MRAPSEAELLQLWEHGRARHPIDRGLLLGAFACPELPAAELADLPLGTLNKALLRLRQAAFGPHVATWVDCPACGVRLEFPLDVPRLLAAGDADARAPIEVAGLRFRLPVSRDLAAVAHAGEVEAATALLLERCCVGRAAGADARLDDVRAEVEARMEDQDPAALLQLDLTCAACAHRWTTPVDVGELVWDELEANARAVLMQVHRLARAYGWTEGEVLALSAARRAAYLELVDA